MAGRVETVRGVGRGCAVAFLVPFCVAGVGTAVASIRSLLSGNLREGGLLGAIALVFCGAGFGLLGVLLRDVKVRKKEARVREAHPGEPWLWREDWAEGRIRCAGKGTAVTACAFAAFWNLLSLPALILVPGEIARTGKKELFLVFLFPLVGLGLLVWAIRATLRWRKFGRSILEMRSVPGVVGGSLAAVIGTGAKLHPEEGFRLVLTSLRRTVSGSGRHRTTHERILWQEERRVTRELAGADPTRSVIPVLFEIPYECEPTDAAVPDDQVQWRLEATASVPGIDYSAVFEVPVYRTERSSPGVKDAEALAETARAWGIEDEAPGPAAGSRIEVRPHGPDGAEFVFPAARNPGAAATTTVFTAVWGGILWLMIAKGVPVVFPIAFGLIELVLVAAVVMLWFGSTRVLIRAGTIEVRSGPFGWGPTRTVACSEVDKIEPEVGMQSTGLATRGRVYYDIKVRTRQGKAVTAGDQIGSKAEAEWLAGRMSRLVAGGR